MEQWGRTTLLPPYVLNILKSTPSVSIILIRVIRIVNCKVCKSSSVRGDPRPLWCIILDGRVRVYEKKNQKNQKNTKKWEKEK